MADQWHSWGIGLHMPEVSLANDIPEEIGYLCSQREMGMSFVVGHRSTCRLHVSKNLKHLICLHANKMMGVIVVVVYIFP